LKHLDLFSGIGGFALAAQWAGIETVAFCEIEPYAQKVLNKNFPGIPIFLDIKKLKRSDIHGAVDIITGGFPCQPFSVAGRKKGTKDDRDLWPQMFRIIQEFKPSWVIGENVANFVNMAFQRTKTDLESEGYEVQPLIIPACAVNAPHRRDRVWIVGYSKHNGSFTTEKQRGIDKRGNNNKERKKEAFQLKGTGRQGNDDAMAYAHQPASGERGTAENSGDKRGESSQVRGTSLQSEDRQACPNYIGQSNGVMADTERIRQPRQRKFIRPLYKKKNTKEETNRSNNSRKRDPNWWEFEPDVGRVAHGVSNRVDRLKGLGNAIVPQVAYQILKGIMML
jgi:DNA (cytosine-5)-methyltransferase 1